MMTEELVPTSDTVTHQGGRIASSRLFSAFDSKRSRYWTYRASARALRIVPELCEILYDDSPAHSPQFTTEDMGLPDLKTG